MIDTPLLGFKEIFITRILYTRKEQEVAHKFIFDQLLSQKAES